MISILLFFMIIDRMHVRCDLIDNPIACRIYNLQKRHHCQFSSKVLRHHLKNEVRILVKHINPGSEQNWILEIGFVLELVGIWLWCVSKFIYLFL